MVEIKSVKKLPYKYCIENYNDFQIIKRLECLKKLVGSSKYKKWNKLTKAALSFELGITCQLLAQFNDALLYFYNAEKIYSTLAKKSDNLRFDLANLNYYMTHIFIEKGDYIQAMNYSDKTLELYSKLNDKEGLGHVYDVQSIIETHNYNFNTSLELAFKSLKIRSEINSDKLRVSFNNIGELFRTEGQYKSALEYYEKAKELYTNDSDLISYAFVLNNIGVVYVYLNDFDNAFQTFNSSQDIFYLLGIYDPECKLDYTKAMIIGLESASKSQFDSFCQQIETNFYELPKHLYKTRSNRLLIQFLITMGDYFLIRNDLYLSQIYYNAGKKISDFNNYNSQSILIRAKLINKNLKDLKLGNSLFCLHNAQEWLEEAKILAYQSLKSPLIIELEFVEAVLSFVNLDIEKASGKLQEIKNIAIRTGNDQLLRRVEVEFTKIREYEIEKGLTTNLDIVEYVSTIARYVRD